MRKWEPKERVWIVNLVEELEECEGWKTGVEGESKTTAKKRETVEIIMNNGFTLISGNFLLLFY